MSKELLLTVTKEIFDKAGIPVSVAWTEGSMPRLCVSSSESLAHLIGKQGLHLGALEHLIRGVAAKRTSSGELLPDFLLDINDYRKARTEELVSIARVCAKRVLETGHAESLPPMNAFERKMIHTELASLGNLDTQSIGTEPNRRVVIKRASF